MQVRRKRGGSSLSITLRYAADTAIAPHVLQAQSAESFKRKQAEAAAAVLKEQMAAKAAKDAAAKELYANKVTEDYFMQFGTSHR